ncbi:replication protein [Paenibacillus alba]|uniref:Replication protein n=1 Tax=Paenibacillus alba TaxID=1197127 RepID=A0ABU6GEX8_9BACL|nr:replication protein [Paenibacillus alba]MEC0231313.1 replication protein [Paenibacillus alba]
MADVQVENGYCRIANEILEHIAKCKLNGTQFRLLMILWRYTYGFQRKEHDLSLTFFANALEINKDQVKRELNSLIDLNIISVVEEATFNSTRVISFNKNYEKWVVPSNEKRVQGAKKTTGIEIAHTQGANEHTPPGGGLAPQERYSFKDNFKENQEEEEKPMTVMDAYFYSFKKWNMTGPITDYVTKLRKRDCSEKFIVEIILLMGEKGINPDIKYMTAVAEDWIHRGINSREEAEAYKERQNSKVTHINQKQYNSGRSQKPKIPGVLPSTPAESSKLTEEELHAARLMAAKLDEKFNNKPEMLVHE